MNLDTIIAAAVKKQNISDEACLKILQFPNEDILILVHAAYEVRKTFFGRKMHIQVLTNIKSGLCTEDCHYCSQSCVSTADIEKYELLPQKDILKEAAFAKKSNAKRYCMALSGNSPTEEEVDSLCSIVKAIKENHDISVCCSLGFISETQAGRLKRAGLDRVNHNLNTSRRYYPEICTTHTFEDRVRNIEVCKNADLEICSGGIVGQGESPEDVVVMLKTLRAMDPDSVPLNFLIPIPGTPFGEKGTTLTPVYCLKVLCLARFLLADKDLRIAGGREYHLRSLQSLALHAANSIFVAGYLTTDGQSVPEAIQMIEDAGFSLEIEGVTEGHEH